jgi:hypothetical protein
MQIKILTERQPWIGGEPRAEGDVVEADAEVAKWLIGEGWAEAVEAEKPKRAARNADA